MSNEGERKGRYEGSHPTYLYRLETRYCGDRGEFSDHVWWQVESLQRIDDSGDNCTLKVDVAQYVVLYVTW